MVQISTTLLLPDASVTLTTENSYGVRVLQQPYHQRPNFPIIQSTQARYCPLTWKPYPSAEPHVEAITGRMQHFLKRGLVRKTMWTSNGYLQTQSIAYDAQGEGTWRPAESSVPTAEGEVLPLSAYLQQVRKGEKHSHPSYLKSTDIPTVSRIMESCFGGMRMLPRFVPASEVVFTKPSQHSASRIGTMGNSIS
jgi:hypothetical protein